VDLNQLLHRHQLSLMQLDRASNPEERLAHSQFACDYAEKIRMARDELGAPAPLQASQNESRFGHECSNSEIRHAACVTARVVLTPAGDQQYKVVVSRGGEECSGHGFDTMREAEAFIRRNTPAPAPRSTLYDRDPAQ
jgi:hypothetical protein